MPGLLDFLQTPAGQGLLAAGLGAAASVGRGRGLVGNLGAGGLMGLQAYTGAQDQQARLAQEKMDSELRSLQMGKLKSSLADEEMARNTAAQFYKPGGPAVMGDSGLPPELQTGAVPMPAAAPSFDMKGYVQARMAQNPLEGMKLLSAMQKDTPFNKVDPKDFTAQSIAKFAQTQNYADLVPRTKVEVNSATGMAYDPYNTKPGAIFADPNKPFAMGPNGLVPNTAYQNFEMNKSKAGAARTNVSVNTDKSYFGNVAEGLAKNDVALIDAARSAPDRIASAQRVKSILAQNPITGTGAEARLSLNKALTTAGLIDGKDVANTETLASMLASQTLDAIRTSGLGSGQGFTDKDRQFLERAKSGNIEMNSESLKRLADLNEQSARQSIKRGNSVIQKLQSSPEAGRMGQQLDMVEEPPSAGPAKSVVRKGTYNGRPVIQYSDGTIEYGN